MKLKKSQSVFEYFIITATVAAIAVVFVNSAFWKNINISLNKEFKNGVKDMTK
ncbi:MAG: hypothetical protein KAJ14_06835 [Candidatus Omnitrophica bacterium]|nr:hypothetical protein [Candidatus Omnitrophota bacterium]